MSVVSWLRNLFAGPVRIGDGGDEGAEIAADLDEEFPVAAEDRESLLRAERASGTSAGSKVEVRHEPETAAFEGAQAEEANRDSQAGVSDPDR
jgi:hypothetical protein